MLVAVLAILLFLGHVKAYIPAVPTNNTGAAVNQTDMSMLTMKWSPAGTYSNTVSYQLASQDSDGFEHGALVHFSERNLTDQNTTTLWIALINCDANTTDASQVDDIFTLARDRGAVAALLYSTTSEACLINPEYASPDNFEQILDIFATQSRSSAQIITSQFTNLHNTSFGVFNAEQLNNSAQSIDASIQTNNVTSPFIVATLRAANSTVSPNGTDTDGGNNDSSTNPPTHSNPNTGLAMIILYAITALVSGLFIVVIVSGAIRAIRNPERYGPRAANANANGLGTSGQSRTGGIGRAILDTFPVIKFGQGTPESIHEPKNTDVENQTTRDRNIEMAPQGIDGEDASRVETENQTEASSTDDADTQAGPPSASSMQHAGSSSSPTPPRTLNQDIPVSGVAASSSTREVNPSAIGHETCPICIVDFESGDDLRVLPCEGKHKFHQACVDPWLLELSSSCPLCREDFHALESMIAGEETAAPDSTGTPPAEVSDPATASARSSRFSKYLRFARRRNRASHSRADSPVAERPSSPTAPIDMGGT